MSLYDAFHYLQQVGVADVLLPFILVFTIVFAILEKTAILGDKKNINVAVAMVMGLGVVFPHILGSYGRVDPVLIINSSLASLSVWLIAILSILLLLGFFGKQDFFSEDGISKWVVVAAIVVVGYIFLNSAGVATNIPFLSDPMIQTLLVVILVFGGVVYFVTNEKTEDGG